MVSRGGSASRTFALAFLALLAGVCMVLGHRGTERPAANHIASVNIGLAPAGQVPMRSHTDDHCDSTSAAPCHPRVAFDLVGLLLLAAAIALPARTRLVAATRQTPTATDRHQPPSPIAASGLVGLLCVART